MPLRLIFMGTPDFSVPTLRALSRQGHDIAAVYTRAAKPGGRRGLELVPSPVEREAKRLGLAVHTPASLKGADAQAALGAHRADAAVVVAYGLILPKPILDALRLGCFNLHASLLPRWRGAAPINRAVMAGDAESGATVMKMDEGLDTGDIATEEDLAMMERIRIEADTTAGELHDAMAKLGADLMVRALNALERGTLQFTAQPADGVTYAAKIDKAETRIDWTKPWKAVHDHIRGLSPFPGAWCVLAGDRIKVLRSTKGEGGGTPGTVSDDNFTVACGDGAVRIVELQKAGGRPMKAEEFLRGTPVRSGTALG
jgi:methionyl-tRNA formyltransferase